MALKEMWREKAFNSKIKRKRQIKRKMERKRVIKRKALKEQ